jgi:hypothetical protein
LECKWEKKISLKHTALWSNAFRSVVISTLKSFINFRMLRWIKLLTDATNNSELSEQLHLPHKSIVAYQNKGKQQRALLRADKIIVDG